MAAIATGSPRFDMGRVVNRTFGAIGRNLVVFGLISLFFGAIPYGVLQWAQLSGVRSGATNSLASAGLSLLSVFVSLFSSCLIQASLTHGTVADLNGRKASFGECLATGLRYMLPVLGIGILLGISVMFGILLFIVPGILMMLAWIVAVPAEVVERRGVFASFGRSTDLTRNHRGAIFGLAVAYWILVWVISAAIGVATLGATAAAKGNMVIAVAAFAAAAQSIIGMVGATGVAAIYYELRNIKEGIGPEALASVFD